jgi:hypothetical protein
MLYRNYTYVRDARRNGFQDIKLLSKLTENLQAHVFAQERELDGKKKQSADDKKKWACTHCHGDFHEGGSAMCSLKEQSTKTARSMARKIDKRVMDGETDMANILIQVIAAE